ncbi:hypothetical protein CEXT_330761 [Caerostris extrusa]|uniref:Uncharacterized protein n=1 Tax=Caerostris extrusa TaxID=172846 RepID=A0AAV4TPB0_CAEEX|nr:hypothetical protein CEXT_330761 [Caerostris extrusa]
MHFPLPLLLKLEGVLTAPSISRAKGDKLSSERSPSCVLGKERLLMTLIVSASNRIRVFTESRGDLSPAEEFQSDALSIVCFISVHMLATPKASQGKDSRDVGVLTHCLQLKVRSETSTEENM